MEPAAIAMIIAAVGTALGGLIGVYGKVLYDRHKEDNTAALARQKLANEECTAEDHRADTWAEKMIVALQNDLKTLRAEFNQLRADHLNCERTAAELRAESNLLRAEINVLRKQLSEHEKA